MTGGLEVLGDFSQRAIAAKSGKGCLHPERGAMGSAHMGCHGVSSDWLNRNKIVTLQLINSTEICPCKLNHLLVSLGEHQHGYERIAQTEENPPLQFPLSVDIFSSRYFLNSYMRCVMHNQIDEFHSCFLRYNGDLFNSLEGLLKRRNDVNATWDAGELEGWTLLHLAAGKWIYHEISILEEIAKLAIKYGADLNKQNKNGDTPLHVAVEYGNKAIVLILIEAKANLKIRNNNGYTPLEYAKQALYMSIAQTLYDAEEEK